MNSSLRWVLIGVTAASVGVAFAGGGALVVAGLSEDKEIIRGEGYEVTGPDGWHRSDEVPEFARSSYSALVDDVERVRVLVSRETDGPGDRSLRDSVELDRDVISDPKLLGHGGIRGMTSARPASLDGEPALSYDYSDASKREPIRVRVVTAFRDGVVYRLEFSALEGRFDAQLENLEAILHSWRWT